MGNHSFIVQGANRKLEARDSCETTTRPEEELFFAGKNTTALAVTQEEASSQQKMDKEVKTHLHRDAEMENYFSSGQNWQKFC